MDGPRALGTDRQFLPRRAHIDLPRGLRRRQGRSVGRQRDRRRGDADRADEQLARPAHPGHRVHARGDLLDQLPRSGLPVEIERQVVRPRGVERVQARVVDLPRAAAEQRQAPDQLAGFARPAVRARRVALQQEADLPGRRRAEPRHSDGLRGRPLAARDGRRDKVRIIGIIGDRRAVAQESFERGLKPEDRPISRHLKHAVHGVDQSAGDIARRPERERLDLPLERCRPLGPGGARVGAKQCGIEPPVIDREINLRLAVLNLRLAGHAPVEPEGIGRPIRPKLAGPQPEPSVGHARGGERGKRLGLDRDRGGGRADLPAKRPVEEIVPQGRQLGDCRPPRLPVEVARGRIVDAARAQGYGHPGDRVPGVDLHQCDQHQKMLTMLSLASQRSAFRHACPCSPTSGP